MSQYHQTISRSRLPPELLCIISSLSRHADLPALALTDTVLNGIATPLIYRTIHLHDYSTALKCLSTLALDKGLQTFGRDLAALVRSFFLHDSCRAIQYVGPGAGFGNLLAISVLRMKNLESLRTEDYALKVLLALLSSPHPVLRTLELMLYARLNPPVIDDSIQTLNLLMHAQGTLPQLLDLKVHVPTLRDADLTVVLRNVIAPRANALRCLSLTSQAGGFFLPIVFSLSLPSLERVEVGISELKDPNLRFGASVRSLAVHEPLLMLGENDYILPDDKCPLLEDLSCFPSTVSSFLSPRAQVRRPIHTLRLSYASYDRHLTDHSVDFVPEWSDISTAIFYTTFSAAPLKHLFFQVEKLRIPRLRRIIRHLQRLGSLVLVLMTSPEPADVHALGQQFIRHLPRLRTLRLSDVGYKLYGPNQAFAFARDVPLQREWLAEFARCSSALNRVAFTTEFEWEKGTDGAWYTTECVSDAPLDPEDVEGESSDDEELGVEDGHEVYVDDMDDDDE
ncbi:hypothetical protein C8Q79DRAFT_1102962 [Trametes meyenii]|nr:hypothetical protein C8Q79DRAFT_1102962 [Trametes meyenii]